MKRDKKQTSFVNIGLSSLMVIFLVLCLVTFSILSLSSAKSDYSLSEKLANHRSDYYEASEQAEEILAQVDALLEESYQRQDTYFSDVEQKFQGYSFDGISVTPKKEKEELVLSYSVPLDDDQALDVRLKVTDPSHASTYYEILSWQIVSVADWEGDNTVNLIQPDHE